MKVNNFTINGSLIAAYNIAGVRMISVRVLVEAGAWHETEKEFGLFHLLEHIMMTGTKLLPSFKDISQYKEKYGISCGASTSRSKMTFWFDFPDIYLEESFILIKEILFNSRINYDNFDNESEIIRQEYLDAWNDPYRKIEEEVEEKLFGNNCNLINDVLGIPEIFKITKREKLTRIYRRFFQPRRMFWGISGNYKLENLKNILSRSIPKNIKEVNLKFKVNYFKPSYGKLCIKNNRIKQAGGRIIWELDKIKKTDLVTKFSLNMINYLIGRNSNSALFYRIRQERGLVYQINSNYWVWPNASYFEVSFSCDEVKVNEVFRETVETIETLLKNKVGKEKYLQVKNYLDLGTLMSFSSPSKIADNLAASLFYEGQALSAEETNKIAHQINLEEYRELFKKQIHKDKKLEVSILPKSD